MFGAAAPRVLPPATTTMRAAVARALTGACGQWTDRIRGTDAAIAGRAGRVAARIHSA